MCVQQYMIKVRLDDDRPELVVYCCYVEEQVSAEFEVRRALEHRGHKIKEIVDCRPIPVDASKEWWDAYRKLEFS